MFSNHEKFLTITGNIFISFSFCEAGFFETITEFTCFAVVLFLLLTVPVGLIKGHNERKI